MSALLFIPLLAAVAVGAVAHHQAAVDKGERIMRAKIEAWIIDNPLAFQRWVLTVQSANLLKQIESLRLP